MKRFRYITAILTFCASAVPLYSQAPDLLFRHLDYRIGLPQYSVPSEMVEDELGRIWLGYDKGLYVYDGYSITNYQADIKDSTALPESYIQGLSLDENGRIWVGLRNMGFCIYHPVSHHFDRYIPEEMGGSLPVNRVWDFEWGDKDYVWIAAVPGLVRCDPVVMEFKHFPVNIAGITSSHDEDFLNTVRFVREDPINNNILWLGTRAGLVSFDKSTETFTFHKMPFSSYSLGLDAINYLLTDMVFASDSDLWFTSWAGGLIHYNTRSHEWRQYYRPGVEKRYDIGYGIAKKDNDELWVAFQGSVGVFNTETQQYSFFPTTAQFSNGVKHGYLYADVLETRDGAVIIHGSMGASIGINDKVNNKSDMSSPVLSNILIGNERELEDDAAAYCTELVLGPGENDISFTLAWPVYQINPNQRYYRYYLEGYDNDWVYSGDSRKLQYTNLPSGKYRFMFEASHNGQDWIAGVTTPGIVIRPSIWKHPLMLGGVGLFLVVGIGAFYRIKLNHVRKEQQLKTAYNRKLANNEMKALRAQMNPHFMFNSLNSIKNYILKEDTEAASKYLTKFSKLMRAILRNSENRFVTLRDELHALRLYIEIESRRFSDSFEYMIDIDGKIDPDQVYIPPLLIQPYVENAIWHGLMLKEGRRNLYLGVRPGKGEYKEMLEIEVRDNGIGREAAEKVQEPRRMKKESLGMKITGDRIALIHNALGIDARMKVHDRKDAQGSPCGTTVLLYIPVITDKEFDPQLET